MRTYFKHHRLHVGSLVMRAIDEIVHAAHYRFITAGAKDSKQCYFVLILQPSKEDCVISFLLEPNSIWGSFMNDL